ncbi:hypothetical protein C5F59_001315 [Streptomyces sp. QL37]|uniref:hypothetical protein n=1 Tax=Streptomyces sp. QL37 TaxID=2093747 RepID=UPI000CF2BE05|nr:hypothetical protein [Streptomyces sp. QL37]PPQ55483.1 hypothetical protein C5F59_01305 [Streptomyces sp. QL37]
MPGPLPQRRSALTSLAVVTVLSLAAERCTDILIGSGPFTLTDDAPAGSAGMAEDRIAGGAR